MIMKRVVVFVAAAFLSACASMPVWVNAPKKYKPCQEKPAVCGSDFSDATIKDAHLRQETADERARAAVAKELVSAIQTAYSNEYQSVTGPKGKPADDNAIVSSLNTACKLVVAGVLLEDRFTDGKAQPVREYTLMKCGPECMAKAQETIDTAINQMQGDLSKGDISLIHKATAKVFTPGGAAQ